ncbi:MAG: hypothetical protein KDA61_08580, partial [Planctomycetales bacterium]|nr:hypothetical protein [Planctomycetales bacterium]
PAGEDYAEIWNLTGDRTWNDDNDRGSGLNGLPPSNPARLPAGGNLAVIELPPVPPSLHLQVDPATGFARLTSVVEKSVTLQSYNVESTAGALDAPAWSASNLAARGVDSGAESSAPGQSWQIVNGDAQQVFEAYLFGGSTIAPMGSLLLGKIVDPFTVGAEPELTLEFASFDDDNTSTFATLGAPVEFVSFEVGAIYAADFDQSGAVDAADLTRWAQGFGAIDGALQANGDSNGDGVVDGADFLAWQRQLGAGAASVTAGQPVPEATTLALSVGLGLSLAFLKRRRSG